MNPITKLQHLIRKQENIDPEILELVNAVESQINKIKGIEYDSLAFGCGLEDWGITDRYRAMEYGFNTALSMIEEIMD